MLEIDFNDVLSILKLCIPHFIALGVALAAVIAVAVVSRKMKKSKRFLVNWTACTALFLVVVLVVNLICFGPMSTIIGLATGNGTVSEETANEALAVAEEIAGEGTVLLKNDGLLPLADQKNLNLFGWASVNPVYGGAGSGSINDLWPIVSLEEGLENAGFSLNKELAEFYSTFTADRPKMSINKQAWTLPEPTVDDYSDSLIQNAKDFSDVAVVVIARIGGEGYNDMPTDLAQVSFDNNSDSYEDFPTGAHYLELSQTEKNMLEMVCQNFNDVVLLYNSAHAFELGFVEDYPQIKSVLWCPGTGNVGFNGLGKVMSGAVNPSGRTSDTFVYDLTNTPWWNNFTKTTYTNMEDLTTEAINNSGKSSMVTPAFINYVEGIYVGYKYYETAAAEGFIDYGKTVQYPFGYGLSYTSFTQTMSPLSISGDTISFDVTVTNVGSVAGKDIVEVYYNPPYTNGGVEKSAANLITFEKTDILEPGASQTITISFKIEDMASFDYLGEGCYVLEQGNYIISINSDSHTVLDSQIYTQVADRIYSDGRSTDNIPAVNLFDDIAGDVTYLSRADRFANYQTAIAPPATTTLSQEYRDSYCTNQHYDPAEYLDPSGTMPTTGAKNGIKLAELRGVDFEDPKWDALLDQMTVKEMSNLTALAGFQTQEVTSISKVATIDCDGPASINNNFTGTGSIGFPVAVMIASTWNKDLAYQFGENIGKMANEMNVNGWYAPAMNTHRTPFGGRNFEYYSEDGVLAGNIAANAVAGAKSHGVYAYIKHFAMYDANTMMVSIWSNEQAMREIYFKPFELCVKDGKANAVMCAWAYIGNKWAGATSNLLKTVLRDEWGFSGFVLTDSFGGNGRGFMNADVALPNGCDAMLSTFDAGCNYMTDTTSPGAVIALRSASKNILYTVVNSSAYAEETQSQGMPGWQKVALGVDAALVIAVAALTLTVGKKGYQKRKDVE